MNNTIIPHADATPIATQILAEHAAFIAAGRAALEHARRCGELLADAKRSVPHGAWLKWLATNCPELSVRTVQVYLQVARKFSGLDPNTQHAAHLTLRGALGLIATTKATQPATFDVPVGHVMFAEVLEPGRRSMVFITPYVDPTFVFVNVIVDNGLPDSAGDISGTRRAIRREHVGTFLRLCEFPCDKAGQWTSDIAASGWTFNEMLFTSADEPILRTPIAHV